MSEYLTDPYRQFIHISRYARWLEDKKRRETWAETVNRYVDYMVGHVRKATGHEAADDLVETLREAILTQRIGPSMRALMTAGPALERNNIAGYNCAYLPIDHPRAFDELLYILMNGTGVGFSVEQRYVDQLPVVAEDFYSTNSVVVVDDSKEGWAKSLRELLALLWVGQVPTWDLSRVRQAGERLRVFGGRASGPAPLDDLFRFAVNLFRQAAGRKLTSLEAHDLVCKIASVVVVGGVRRAALISLSDLDDSRMASAKSGQWWEEQGQRALANNSAVYAGKPDIGAFMREWLALYASKSGERGIFNRAASTRQVAKHGRRNPDHVWGTNPCLAYDTLLLTSDGLRPIGELAESGETFQVYNGDGKFTDSFAWKTGTKTVYRLGLSNGLSIDLTSNHVIEVMEEGAPAEKAVSDLNVGMKVRPFVAETEWEGGADIPLALATAYGVLFGDGYVQRNGGTSVYIDTTEREVIEHLADAFGDRFVCLGDKQYRVKGAVPEMAQYGFSFTPLPSRQMPKTAYTWRPASVRAFLCGLFSANGNSLPKHARVTLKATNKEMIQAVQRLMSALGFSSYITTNKPQTIEWSNGEYTSRESYDLNVASGYQYHRFLDEIGFLHEHKMVRTERSADSYRMRCAAIVSIEEIGVQDVYDFHESITHWGWGNGFKVHNCSEIILRPFQFCNLTTVVVRPEDDLKTLLEKVRLATILGTWQSTLTNFKYLRRKWRENTEEERLLGVSMTGQLAHPVLSGLQGFDLLETWLIQLREEAVRVNAEFAGLLGIPVSAAITCVKPEGTTSQLYGVPAGMGTWYGKWFLRTVRGDKKDAVTRFLGDVGIPAEDEIHNPSHTTVFAFPQRAPAGALTRNDLTAVEHLEIWLAYQRHWCEHKPSVTINVREDEWMAVGAWVYEHFDEVTGVSFLPHTEHIYQQAPYQELGEQQYLEAVKAMPKEIRWADLVFYETEDGTTGSQELACSAGGCDVVDIAS